MQSCPSKVLHIRLLATVAQAVKLTAEAMAGIGEHYACQEDYGGCRAHPVETWPGIHPRFEGRADPISFRWTGWFAVGDPKTPLRATGSDGRTCPRTTGGGG